MSRLAVDDANHPTPVMGFRTAADPTRTVNFTATSQNTSPALPVGEDSGTWVSVYVTEDCYIMPGDSSVVADSNSHFCEAGSRREFYVRRAHGHIAVVRATTNGTMYVSVFDGTP